MTMVSGKGNSGTTAAPAFQRSRLPIFVGRGIFTYSARCRTRHSSIFINAAASPAFRS